MKLSFKQIVATKRLLCIALVWIVFSTELSAHHSTAFYGDEVLELEGELLGVKWRNPHVTWQLMVTGADGTEVLWNLEGASTYPLKRAGVTRDLFVIGDRIKVAGNLSLREDNVFLAKNMLLPDGKELLLWGNIAAHFDDANRLADAASENKGIFRVWSTPSELFRIIQKRLSGLPYRDSAIAARELWDPLDNFVMRCEQEGMPRIMVNPHPFQFIDNGDTMTLHTELYDIKRTIHMNQAAPPANETPSHLGHSVGVWESGALVVTTTMINWPYFDNIGTPQSDGIVVTEKFFLSQEEGRLNLEMTVVDDTTFTEPAVIEGYWLALGEEMPPPYNCEPGRPGD